MKCRIDNQLTTIFFLINGLVYTSASLNHIRNKRWDDAGQMNNAFRGTAGIDYPDLKAIPNTNFRCEEQIYEGGLYADVEANCQVYHICHDGRKDSFMCGRGTIFNQQILACDYWYSTTCETAPSFYYVNSQIGSTYTHDPSQYENQRQPHLEEQISLGRSNQQNENTNLHNSYDDNNNAHASNNGVPDHLRASNVGDTWNENRNYNQPENGYYNQPENGYYNQPENGYYNQPENINSGHPEYRNYNQPENGNESHDQNNQSPCKGWGNGSNKTPWSFPLRLMSD